MSRTTTSRRPRVQRLALAGIGGAVLLVGIASPAAAADVVISLEPAEVGLIAVPVENFPDMDPMADPMSDPMAVDPVPVDAEFGDTLTVELPDVLDASGAVVELIVDVDGDGAPDGTYSSAPSGTELPLTVDPVDGDTVEVVLPAGTGTATAALSLEPVVTTLGAGFTFIDPVEYVLTLGDTALDEVTLEPVLLAASAVLCADPAACTVTAGSTVTVDLTDGSLLRELGITDLSGVQVAAQAVDADGLPVGEPVLLTAEVAGSTATVAIPADQPAGTYALAVVQETPTGYVSVVAAELTVTEPVAAPAPAPAEPTEEVEETTVNAGLRSNTGVEAVPTGSTGTVAAVAGAGLLAAAGVGGVAVARSRRRPAAESGTCAD
ncbi:hypothetical protein SAMN06893096_103425 [Geodermatophilus pulveris]|uniref:Uncharacterized protein n=1 Tax=Geodermatophilus pulveris TaxID=1564159 RepID=A0A239DXL0_9ACTN|nr:hypothetical protein [Geodermatophilus pulveris]SNS37255.1 hypothetical protein SAMN06893096_103425 [Geodermatophilus pulveris]